MMRLCQNTYRPASPQNPSHALDVVHILTKIGSVSSHMKSMKIQYKIEALLDYIINNLLDDIDLLERCCNSWFFRWIVRFRADS
jgi:hypothetical protein